MRITGYDLTIDTDGDGSTITGKITITNVEYSLYINGGGRDLDVELDGFSVDENTAEELTEWFDPFDAVEAVISEELGQQGLQRVSGDIEDWSGRVVSGKVVRLIARVGRELRVIRGTLVDDV